MTAEQASRLRRLALRSLVAGLTVGALAAIVALLQGSFDETEVRVVVTSLALSTFGSLSAVAASTQASRSVVVRRTGLTASVLAGAAFVLFLPAVWINEADEGLWQAFGCVAVGAVATCHAALVLRGRRSSDGDLVTIIVSVSVALGALDGLGAILAIAGVTADIDAGLAQIFGVSLVLLLLTTALPPLLRRLERPREAPAAPRGPHSQTSSSQLASEVTAIADRIDELIGSPGSRAPEIRREVVRLRRLARSIDG